MATEVSTGTYTIGPLILDRAGRWTLVLHLYGHCLSNTAQSAHGHATFTMDVL
jgi:hypothetical protein